MDIYDRARNLIEPYAYQNDAYRLALVPIALANTWNTNDLYTPVDLASASLLAITQPKGNHYQAYNYVMDRAAALNVPVLAPSDSTLLRRLERQANPDPTDRKTRVRHNITKTRDYWAEIYRAQNNILTEVCDLRKEDLLGVFDASTGPLFEAPKARRVGPKSEAQANRSAAMRSHGGAEGVPIYNGTDSGIPFHNATRHSLDGMLSGMVYSEFEKTHDLLGHVDNASKAMKKLEHELFALSVDKYYIQNQKVMDCIQSHFDSLGTWIFGPMKRYQWVKALVHRSWNDAQEIEVAGEALWWTCDRVARPGFRSYHILGVYAEVPEWWDEKESNGLIVQDKDGVRIAGFPMWINHEVTSKSATRILGIRRRRWAGETFFKWKGYSGDSQASYLFPRQYMNGAIWSTGNAYGIWRGVRQNRYDLPNHDPELGLHRFRNRVQALAEDHLRRRGQELRDLDSEIEAEAGLGEAV